MQKGFLPTKRKSKQSLELGVCCARKLFEEKIKHLKRNLALQAANCKQKKTDVRLFATCTCTCSLLMNFFESKLSFYLKLPLFKSNRKEKN